MTERLFKLLVLVLSLAEAASATTSFAQQNCAEDMQKLAQVRNTELQKVNDFAAAAHGEPLDPEAFCATSAGLIRAESALIAYMEKNKDWCSFPGEAINQLKEHHAKNVGFNAKACTVAAQTKNMNLNGAPSLAANTATCSTNITVHLTVVLKNEGTNVLTELRQGVVGHSKVVNRKTFYGKTGTVFFANVCAGSYFMDIGNGPLVAVTPVHQYGNGERVELTIVVTFSKGNVSRQPRNSL